MLFVYMHFFLYFCRVLEHAARMMFLRVFQNRNKIKNHYNERFIQMA